MNGMEDGVFHATMRRCHRFDGGKRRRCGRRLPYQTGRPSVVRISGAIRSWVSGCFIM